MTNPKQYAEALFSLAKEDGSEKRVLDDVGCADKVLKENPEYEKLIDTPAISKEERLSLVEGAFGSLDKNLVNLVKIIASKREMHSIHRIFAAYKNVYDEHNGILRAEIISAIPLSEEQEKKAKERLEKITGKNIVIKNTVDPEILGGITLRYSGVQLDGSVRSRLEDFKRRLRGAVI